MKRKSAVLLGFLFLSLFLYSCSTKIIRDCCLDAQSCAEMEAVRSGHTIAEIVSVTGEGCDKKIKVRMIK
jgi:hypothetical protein